MLRYRLRLLAARLTGWIPTKLLRAFLKSFDSRQELAEAAGYNIFPRRFDSPFPEIQRIDWALLQARRELPGVELNLSAALEWMPRLGRFAPELDAIPYDKVSGVPFWFNNASFTDFDAAVLYALLREMKPKRYIEVGCGFSSLVSALAIQKNIQDGHPCQATYIDPEPRLDLREKLKFANLLLRPVQAVPPAFFQSLESGDVLFIDTSHVLKLQGDVAYEQTEILPALQPGVLIHIHDIFTPYDYPEDWVRRPPRHVCNEQYAVECLLSGGDRFRVELPLFCLWQERRESLHEFFPRGRNRPQSFWIRRNI